LRIIKRERARRCEPGAIDARPGSRLIARRRNRDDRRQPGREAGLRGVTTTARLERLVRPFKLVACDRRRFAPDAARKPSIHLVQSGAWQESSPGDSMHKMILVLTGQVDVEGGQGGWLIIPNHIIFIPADRAYNLRTAPNTTVIVAYLDPGDAEWQHHGCWVTRANGLAHEMVGYLLKLYGEAPESETVRQMFRTLSLLCRDWFSNPRILWLPQAKSAATRAFITYVRDRLSSVTVAEACRACNLPQRTMQRIAQEEFGHGLRVLISEIRMMRAMELLVKGESSVEAVARSVGFNSLGSFTAAFSERVGLSPGEFKQRNRAALRACPSIADSDVA
jgi:AraC-like DNA-binding protein